VNKKYLWRALIAKWASLAIMLIGVIFWEQKMTLTAVFFVTGTVLYIVNVSLFDYSWGNDENPVAKLLVRCLTFVLPEYILFLVFVKEKRDVKS
jgi:hypothetical protein